jgi:hypothetical protein
MIKLINYDFIDPSTSISISFAAIESLPEVNVNTISIGVQIYYNDEKNSSTYLYIPTATLPTPTNLTSFDVDRNMSGWVWDFYTEFYNANIVLSPATFRLRLRVPYSSNYSGYQYSSTGQDDEFILMKFTPKFLIDPYNLVNMTCSNCTDL